MIPKKQGGENGEPLFRCIVDFRNINKLIAKDCFPISNITEILDKVSNSKLISTLDAKHAFQQINLTEDSQKYTAFVANNNNLYLYQRSPMRLCCSPLIFCRLMQKILETLGPDWIFAYLHDLIMIANTLEQHSFRLRKLLQRLKEAKLLIDPKKCFFLRREITKLLHVTKK